MIEDLIVVINLIMETQQEKKNNLWLKYFYIFSENVSILYEQIVD